MKVKEIIELQVRDLGMAGVEPRHILMTPRALAVLTEEVGGDMGNLDQSRLDGEITFMNLPVILDPERSRFLPVSVVGSARSELDVYMLRESKRRN